MQHSDKQKRLRIFFTGVGGQGTLTATTLLARTALDAGQDVVAGEVHGMAQRGGSVSPQVRWGKKVYGPSWTLAKPTSCWASSPWRPCAACPTCAPAASSSPAVIPCRP